MVKKIAKYFRDAKSHDGRPTLVGDTIYELLRKMGGSSERSRLAGLWRNWEEAVGEEFAWATPLSHKGDILVLGVDDSMEIQELSMYSSQILKRVNSWLQSEYFSSLKIVIRITQS